MEQRKKAIGKNKGRHLKKLESCADGGESTKTTRQRKRTRNKESKKQVNKNKNKVTEELIKAATWNIRGSYQEGKLKHLINEVRKYKFDLVALQETKQWGQGSQDMDDYVFFNSGGSNRLLGTGFIISKKLKEFVSDFKAISDRLCTLRLKGKYQKITFVNIHAPSEEKGIELKEQFYSKLDEVYEAIPRYDMKIILGDANAKIGREEILMPTIGKHSLHAETNENGYFLVDFAKEKGLIIKSTYHQRKDIYKGTWRSPDGRTVNQIDHVLIEKNEENCITKVRTYRGPDMDSDHYLVGIWMKQLVPNLRNKKKLKYERSKPIRLQTESEQTLYGQIINNKLESIVDESNVECMWGTLRDVIKEAANISSANDNKKKKQKEWFDKECEQELEERARLRLKMITKGTREAQENYIEQRNKTKKVLRKKKRKHYEAKLENIEESYKNNQIRNLYQGIKNEKRGHQPKTVHYKDKNGEMIMGEPEVLARWKQYFDELLNGDEQTDDNNEEAVDLANRTQNQQSVEQAPTISEIQNIIENLKMNKSPGSDCITAEMIKFGGHQLADKIQKLIRDIWEQEILPEEWTEAILCPIHKKGNMAECQNYRGIALLNIAYKILAMHIKNRLTAKVDKSIGEYQCGFRKGRSTVDQIFTLREIQAESYEYNKDTMALFIDFKQAFDRVKRRELFAALQDMDVCPKLIRIIKLTLQRTVNKVKINNSITESFEVKEGVRQGDPLSSIMFSIILEKVIQEANINRTGLIYHKKHQCLAFADDLVILARSKRELMEIAMKLEERAATKGLYINEAKTKYIEWTNKQFVQGQYITMTTARGTQYKFEEVERFEYLGTVFTREPNYEEEMHRRIMSGNRAIYALNGLLRNKNISRRAKLRTYKTVIRPIVTYASETWVITKKHQELLLIWERKILRKIFGGKNINGQWMRRTNNELAELYQEPKILAVIKAQRLRWLGHVQRMVPSRIPRMVVSRGLAGKRRRGRPRSRWINEVKEDMRRLNVTNWERKATDKREWKRIVHQAMSLLGS